MTKQRYSFKKLLEENPWMTNTFTPNRYEEFIKWLEKGRK